MTQAWPQFNDVSSDVIFVIESLSRSSYYTIVLLIHTGYRVTAAGLTQNE